MSMGLFSPYITLTKINVMVIFLTNINKFFLH